MTREPNKEIMMKTSIAIILAAAMTACGGPTGRTGTGVAFDSDMLLPGSPQSVSMDVFTDAAGTTLLQTVNVPNCASSSSVGCWDPPTSKFRAYAINLPGSAAPGTDYWLTVKFWSAAAQGGTVVGLIPLKNFKVISGQVNTTTIAQDTVQVPAGPGVYVSAITGAATVVFGATKTLSVTATDPSAVPGTLTYLWSTSGAGCAGFVLSTNGLPTIDFTAGTTAGTCTVTVLVTTSTVGVPGASPTVKLTVAADTSIVVNGVPPPVITNVGLTSNNSADAVCSINKPGAGWTGANTTCPLAFGLAATAQNPANRFAAHGYFGNITLKYDVCASAATDCPGINPNAPPTVATSVFCTNDTKDYGSDPAKPKTLGFNPGYQVGLTGSVFAADGYWAEPGFTVAVPANWSEFDTYAIGDKVLYEGNRYTSLVGANLNVEPLGAPLSATNWSATPFVAGDYTPNWTAPVLCTFTVKVSNEGGSDTVPFYAFFQ